MRGRERESKIRGWSLNDRALLTCVHGRTYRPRINGGSRLRLYLEKIPGIRSEEVLRAENCSIAERSYRYLSSSRRHLALNAKPSDFTSCSSYRFSVIVFFVSLSRSQGDGFHVILVCGERKSQIIHNKWQLGSMIDLMIE